LTDSKSIESFKKVLSFFPSYNKDPVKLPPVNLVNSKRRANLPSEVRDEITRAILLSLSPCDRPHAEIKYQESYSFISIIFINQFSFVDIYSGFESSNILSISGARFVF